MNEYISYLKVIRKRTAGTLKQYQAILNEFKKYEPITRASFSRYALSISENRPKTQRNKLTFIKSYLNWKADTGRIKAIERFWNYAQPPADRTIPRALELEQVKAILQAIDNNYWRAFFSFLVNTGARISEAIHFEPEQQATLNGNHALIRFKGKGSRERVIRIHQGVLLDAIEAGIFSKPPTVSGANQAIKKYAKRAGLVNWRFISPHTLRHSFAIAQLERGLRLNQLQAILGHSSLTTTGLYLTVASQTVDIAPLV